MQIVYDVSEESVEIEEPISGKEVQENRADNPVHTSRLKVGLTQKHRLKNRKTSFMPQKNHGHNTSESRRSIITK